MAGKIETAAYSCPISGTGVLRCISQKTNKSVFLWEIADYQEVWDEVKTGERSDREGSPAFYSHPDGYKMYVHIHPNGFGHDHGTHLTATITILCGENDDSLPWPFMGCVTFAIMHPTDSIKNAVSSINAAIKGNEGNWGRPQTAANRGFGSIHLLALEEISGYLTNGMLSIKVTIHLN